MWATILVLIWSDVMMIFNGFRNFLDDNFSSLAKHLTEQAFERFRRFERVPAETHHWWKMEWPPFPWPREALLSFILIVNVSLSVNTLPCQKFHCAIVSFQQTNVPLVHWDEPMLRKFQGRGFGRQDEHYISILRLYQFSLFLWKYLRKEHDHGTPVAL